MTKYEYMHAVYDHSEIPLYRWDFWELWFGIEQYDRRIFYAALRRKIYRPFAIAQVRFQVYVWYPFQYSKLVYLLTHRKEQKEMRALADSLSGRPVTNKDIKYLLKCAASRERWTPEELQEMLGTETKKGNGAG